MIAYHIDRKNILSQNQNIELNKNIIIYSKNHLSSIIHSNYPDGLSSHGIRYYANACITNKPEYWRDFLKENILEYERRIHFPESLSRYQSFFAVENMEKLNMWKKILNLKDNSFQVFKIEYEEKNSIELDASWIDKITSYSFLNNNYYAIKYWSGEISNNPKMELLIKPPIKIVEKVKI